MFCEKCGSKLEDDSKFCGSCGSNIENVVDAEVAEKVEVSTSTDTMNVVKPEALKSAAKGFSITALILGLVPILIIWIPVVNFLVVPIAVLAIIFGVIGLKRENAKGLSLAGLITGILSLVLFIVVMIFIVAAGIGTFTSIVVEEIEREQNRIHNENRNNNRDWNNTNDRDSSRTILLDEERELLGTWSWDTFSTTRITFNEDGTGNRNWFGSEEFTWFYLFEELTLFCVDFEWTESWSVTIEDDEMELQSNDNPFMRYTYRRVR